MSRKIWLPALKAAVAAIPYVGGSLNSIICDIQSVKTNRAIERLNEWFCELQRELQSINEEVRIDFIKDDEFREVLEDVVLQVMTTRQQEKRKFLKNLVVNSTTNDKITYDTIDKFRTLLEQVQTADIIVLKAVKEVAQNGNIKGTGIKEIIELARNEGVSEDDLRLSVYSLEGYMLMEHYRDNYQFYLDELRNDGIGGGGIFYNGHDYLTPLGNKFIEYCTE